jgi:hypothetical protein
MSNVNQTPNMNLPNPVPGQDPGPDYANNLQSSLNIVDQHNHSAGSGVPINPSGININADLPLNDNNLTAARSVRLIDNITTLSGSSDLSCLYAVGTAGLLYYTDQAGNITQMTISGGGINATSSGISSGTASASFVSSVLVVNAATNTPANIQAASVLIGNNSAGSSYVTLSPVNALGSSYGLILPVIPAATSFLTLDTSGNIVASESTTGGITTTNLASQAVTNNKLALGLQMQTSNLGSLASSGAVAMNVATANAFYVVATAAITLTVNVSNFIDGQAATIMVNSGGFAVTVAFSPATGAMKYQGGVQLAQSTGIDIYTIIYNAITGNYYVTIAQDY